MMTEEEREKLRKIVEELDRLKEQADHRNLMDLLQYYRELGLRQLRIELNEMDLVTLQYTYDMALQHDEFEVCEVALPILNQKKELTD
jgi:hypothetical protein